ncbi:MAG TPA: polysaccharide deacetylase family protein [Bryobacteraceae bacterium]|nr:polysaccharide deacetylase family protein [Bryobacteraceae bacterium]
MNTTAAIFLMAVAMAAHGQVKLILHGDDFGMSHSANRATIELLETNSISSASIMVPCPWVLEAAEYARTHPQKDIGLHLTLTSEWQKYRWGTVASRDQVKGLLDPEGYMWRSVQQVAMHATAAEVETELRAQVEKAKALGIRFTHLDTHMGTLYARPDYFQVFEKLGKEYGVPILRLKPSPEAERAAPPAVVRYLLDNEQRFQNEKVFRLDSLLTDPTRGTKTLDERRAAYHKAIKALKPGVHMLIIHAGFLDEEMKGITSSAQARDWDYRTFINSQPFFKGANVQLAGWQDVTR